MNLYVVTVTMPDRTRYHLAYGRRQYADNAAIHTAVNAPPGTRIAISLFESVEVVCRGRTLNNTTLGRRWHSPADWKRRGDVLRDMLAYMKKYAPAFIQDIQAAEEELKK